MRVVAFDIGIKNFAFAVMDLKEDKEGVWGDVVALHVQDLSGDPPRHLIHFMKSFQSLWEQVDLVLIEQQLYRMNIKAAQLSCHLQAYFYHCHPDKPVYEYPSSYKTKHTQCPLSSSTHRQRKEYAVRLVLDHYRDVDPVAYDWVLSFPKKDDVCDCILMCNTLLVSPLGKKLSALMKDTHDKTDFLGEDHCKL